MIYVVKPSLEHIALVKTVVILWDQNDIRALITKICFIYFCDTDEKWQKIEDKIREKVLQLLLPETVKMKLLCFIKPIGLEILELIRYHRRIHYVDLPVELYWLPQGTVDKKRTAEVLINDETLDIGTRYKLACMYCFEDDIEKLWYQMPVNVKDSFPHSYSLKKLNMQNLVFFWTSNMRKKDLDNAQAHTSYKSAFQFCAKFGFKEAAEYFFQKLTPGDREETLMKTAKYAVHPEVFCFLLTKINEDQLKIFEDNFFGVVQYFLNWPLQSFFLEIADHMWDILSKEQYIILLENIIKKVAKGYKDWNYKNLFKEYWQKSPNALKSFNANDFDSGFLRSTLFKMKDKEILSLILENVILAEKKRLIYSSSTQNTCCYLILGDQWDLLECFIKTCLPSESERMKFKEEFKKQIKEFRMQEIQYCLRSNEQKWNQLFGVSEDSIRKYNKRSLGGDESSSSKRLCDLQ